MTDAEFFLLGWAVVATVMYFKTKAEKDSLGSMLKLLFMHPEARDEIFAKFDKFKKANGA